VPGVFKEEVERGRWVSLERKEELDGEVKG
jgi:hypothetical protein